MRVSCPVSATIKNRIKQNLCICFLNIVPSGFYAFYEPRFQAYDCVCSDINSDIFSEPLNNRVIQKSCRRDFVSFMTSVEAVVHETLKIGSENPVARNGFQKVWIFAVHADS